MKKIIYMLLTIGIMFIGVNKIDAEEVVRCNYDYKFNGKSTTLSFSVDSTNNKNTLIKSFDNEYDNVYAFKDKEYIKKIISNSTIGSCPLLSFATFASDDDTYVSIVLTDSTAEPCAGIDEPGYECTAQTGVQGKQTVLSNNYEVKDENEIYCSNTYEDSKLGKVKTETFTDGKENYFRMYDSEGNILGTALAGSYFEAADKNGNKFWFSSPNKASLYSKNCDPSELVLNASIDIAQEQTDKKDFDDEQETIPVTSGETVKLIREIYDIIKIAIPVLIVILSIVDFLKVILLSDEKDYKTAWNKFIKRLIIGVIFFIVPAIVSLLINISGVETEQSFIGIFK